MFEIALVELERHHNEMCGCADRACADRVARAHDTWRATTADELGGRTPDRSQVERRALHEHAYTACFARWNEPS